MDLGLKDKVVAITGGTAGIGSWLVSAFLKEGCKISVCGRNSENNAIMQNEFPEILVVKADVSKKAELENFANQTEDKFGGIDIWINNAGINISGNLIDMSEDDWDSMMNINTRGVFIATKIAVAKINKRGGGVIINASSFSTCMPNAGSGAYAASKFAVNALTKAFAAELAPQNIRVVGYIPGVFDTPMNTAWLAQKQSFLESQIALNRIGKEDDIANAIVFLASEQAKYITGVNLEISGGKFCVQNPQAPWE